METKRAARDAFPSRLAGDAFEVEQYLSVMPHSTATSWFCVRVGGELVQIPERIHFHSESYRRVGLSRLQSDMIECLLTRGYDGLVRERALRSISQINAPWVIPFVVRLTGDYVIEILNAILERRDELDLDAYRQFLSDNERFGVTTRSRVISYWNAYHRSKFPNRSDYVGCQLLALFALQ